MAFDSVAGQHDRVVAVQVHRVRLTAVVGDPDLDDVPLAHHEHRHVRVELAVDAPPQARLAVEEARSAADGVLELPVGLVPCRSRRRRTSRSRAGRARPRAASTRRRLAARRADRRDPRPASICDAYGAAVGRHPDLEVGAATGRDAHRPVGDLGRLVDVDPVDRAHQEGRARPRRSAGRCRCSPAAPEPARPGCGPRRAGHPCRRRWWRRRRRDAPARGRPAPPFSRSSGCTMMPPSSPPVTCSLRQLVGVVPVAPRVGCDPAVGVVLAHADGVLGDPGDPVLRVRDVDPVPVQGHPTLDRLVVQPHLDELADRRLDQRPG